jgi:hypothetical protein
MAKPTLTGRGAESGAHKLFLRWHAATTDAEKDGVLADLTHLAIAKCRGLYPPFSTDEKAETFQHAEHRKYTNRYIWIRNWLRGELANPPAGDNGNFLVQRCRWRLNDLIRKDGRRREREKQDATDFYNGIAIVRPKRVNRKLLPNREELLSHFEGFEAPADPVLRDLWERLLETYPDWRLMTDKHLAVIYGVHENTVRSRRHALAAIMHDQAQTHSIQGWLLDHCLRLKVGGIRKTDLFRTGLQLTTRRELVTAEREIGISGVMWDKVGGDSFPQAVPRVWSIDKTAIRPIRQKRCEHVENGFRCTYAQSKCPLSHHKRTI